MAGDVLDGVHAVHAAADGVGDGFRKRPVVADAGDAAAYEDHHFAARVGAAELIADLAGGAAEELLVEFGEFAGKDDGTLAEDSVDIVESFENTVGRFIEDQSGGGFGPGFERFAALALLGREKAAEGEGIGGQSRGAQGGEDGGGAGDGNDGDTGRRGGGDEAIAGVGNEGRARVADQRYFFAGAKGGQEFFAAILFIVLVVAHQRLLDSVVIEEFSAVARVFTGDAVNLVLQNTNGSKGDVFKVSDGGGDKIECG